MSNLIPFMYGEAPIRAVTINEEPWFVARDIAGVLDYSDAEAMTRKLDEDEKQNLQIVGFGPRGASLISEAGLYSAILTSQKPEAKRFKRWVTHEVLPSIRKTGGYQGAPAAKLPGELAIMECYTRLLRPARSSQVAMLERIAKQNGLDAGFLPGYVVDAPDDAPPGSALATDSLTALLKTHGIPTKTAAYNVLLRDAGMLELRTRKSTSKRAVNGEKQFWCITERGLRYGKNVVSPESPKETQPHWYVERFADLNKVVSGRLLGDALEPRRYSDEPASTSIARREAV